MNSLTKSGDYYMDLQGPVRQAQGPLEQRESLPEARSGTMGDRQIVRYDPKIADPLGLKRLSYCAQEITSSTSVNSWSQSEKAYLDGLRREIAVQYLAKTDVDPEGLKAFILSTIDSEDAKKDFVQRFDKAFGTKDTELFLTTIIDHLSEVILVEIIRHEGFDIHVRQDESPAIFAFSEESLEKLHSYVLHPEVGFSGVIAVHDAGGSHSAIASAGVDSSTPFCMHSVGKVFTGVLALRLIQKGIIDEKALDEAVQLDQETLDKLPEKVRLYLQDPATRPTLGQLMRHEGGLGDYLKKYLEALRQGQKIPEIESPKGFLQYADEETGARLGSYSNLGLLLVGLSLQQLTGKPFDVLLQELVEEAEMNFLSSKKPDGALFNPAHPEAGNMCGSPAGGYWTTAQDLCSFGSWISKVWRTEPRFKELIEKYGKEFYSGGEISHNGGSCSASAYLSVFPEQGLTVAILSDKRYPGAEEMNEFIRAHMMR